MCCKYSTFSNQFHAPIRSQFEGEGKNLTNYFS